jgi:hypothetical protein
MFSGATYAICVFAKTDTYKDEFHRWREVRCLEVCPTACGGPPSFEWNSRIEDLGNYVENRIEYQQKLDHVKSYVPALECLEILRGLN